MNWKLWLRGVWMLGFGWWLAILWLMTGFSLCLTIIGYPIGSQMIGSTYTILTGKFE